MRPRAEAESGGASFTDDQLKQVGPLFDRLLERLRKRDAATIRAESGDEANPSEGQKSRTRIEVVRLSLDGGRGRRTVPFRRAARAGCRDRLRGLRGPNEPGPQHAGSHLQVRDALLR